MEDLVNIQEAFQEEHGVNFHDWVNRECSAEYRDLLCSAKPKRSICLLVNYDGCLVTNMMVYEDFKTVGGPAKAVLHQQGKIVVLQCHYCEHYVEPYPDEAFAWYFRSHLTGEDGVLEKSQNKRLDFTDDHSLVIHEITMDDSGLYSCVIYGATQSSYHVDVVPYFQIKKVLHPTPEGYFRNFNLKVFTDWQEWGRCGKCGIKTERRRLGMCTVRQWTGTPYSPTDELYFLKKYPNGVPCESLLLPVDVGEIPEIQNRTHELQNETCYVPCTTQAPVKYITDKNKKVIEVVEVAKGFVSLREGKLPKPPVLVKRKTVYRTIGSPILLMCPHENANFANLRWQNGTHVLDKATISVRTHGRVTVTELNQLVITQLYTTDTAAYSCWVDDKHISTIKIRVVPGLQADLEDYVIIAGVILSLLTLMYIGLQTVKLNRKHRKSLR